MRPAYISAVIEQEFSSTQQGYHTPVMIWGPPGVGKSQIVAQVAENHGAALVDIRLSQMEPSDLRGIPFKNGAKVEWAIPAMLPEVAVHGEAGLLFIDEITSAPPSVSAAAYQLILDRRLGEYRVPEHWAIVAAGNRQGDRGVTYSMPAPLANRFSHFDVDINLDDWVAWAYANGIDDYEHIDHVPVAVASDNCRDPFYGYGDLDLVEVFREAVRIAHLDRPLGDLGAAAPGSVLVRRADGAVLFHAAGKVRR